MFTFSFSKNTRMLHWVQVLRPTRHISKTLLFFPASLLA